MQRRGVWTSALRSRNPQSWEKNGGRCGEGGRGVKEAVKESEQRSYAKAVSGVLEGGGIRDEGGDGGKKRGEGSERVGQAKFHPN